MKNLQFDKPILLSLIIIVGFAVYLTSNQMMRDRLIKSNPDTSVKIKIGKKTVQLKKEVSDIQRLKTVKGKKRNYLNVFPATAVWISFHSVALALGIVVAWLMLFLIRSLVREFHIKWSLQTLLPFIILLIGTFILFLVLKFDIVKMRALLSGDEVMKYFGIIFQKDKELVQILVGVFLAIAVVPLIGIILINIAAKKLPKDDGLKENGPLHYKSLRDKLNSFALFAGLLVAVSVIGTKLQKKMLGEQIDHIDLMYPDEFIYLYALTFTLVLALFFLPSLFHLKHLKGQKNIEVTKDVQSFGWWKVGKESVDDLKLIISLILPLVSSFLQMA